LRSLFNISNCLNGGLQFRTTVENAVQGEGIATGVATPAQELQLSDISNTPPRQQQGSRILRRDESMTVADLWQEWTIGLDGGPAIRDLERRSKSWRRDKTESRFFNRRHIILDAIQKKVSEGFSEEAAIAYFEQMRRGAPLNYLSKEIPKQQRQGTSSEVATE
jgi:hypothetical protein